MKSFSKKSISLILIFVMLMTILMNTVVNAATTKTEDVVEALKETVKAFNGTVNYENDNIEIEWSIQNSKLTEMSYSYNGSIIEYNPGEVTNYDEATAASNHAMYAIYLIKAALRVNGYTDEQIQEFFSDNTNQFDYDLNGIELEEAGESKQFTSSDGSSSITMQPIRVKIDVTKANLNKPTDDPIAPKTTTIENVIDNLQSDSNFTTTKYEGKVVSENEIYCDDDTITINNTYYFDKYYNLLFNCEDDVLTYEDGDIESYDDAEIAESHHYFAMEILTIALQNNGYTAEQIQEFLSSEENSFNYDLNGVEFEEIGVSKKYTSSDGTESTTVSPMSIRIDFKKTNLKTTPDEEKEEYTVNSNTNSGDLIIFTAAEGKVYSFYIKDRLATTDEELKEIVNLMNDPKYTFEILKEQLNKLITYGKNAAGTSGTLLKLYELYLYDNGVEVHEVDGGFKIKLKITDDMKGYDSYKLIYIADDGTTEKAIELTKNGDYLEGTLPHLSMYALVGSKDETTINPKTDDSIITVFSIFIVSTLGVFTTIKFNRK